MCNKCSLALEVEGPDGATGIVNTFEIRVTLAKLGKSLSKPPRKPRAGSGALQGLDSSGKSTESESDQLGQSEADKQLAIIGREHRKASREDPVRTCSNCFDVIGEFHAIEKKWVAFVDKWLCDQVGILH